jgi:hypothetical protein
MGLQSKHPAVSEVVTPTSARSAVGTGGDTGPLASILESATPHVAVAQADLEHEVAKGNADNANARERALAGHRAPDTVDLPEAEIRAKDNAEALTGTGEVIRPDDAPETAADTTGGSESATPAKPKPSR